MIFKSDSPIPSTASRGLPAAAAATLLVIAAAGFSVAEEPYLAFLEGLRLRGYHDMALAYIDHLETRDDVPASVRETLPYERAVTLESAADDADDPAQKARCLDAALAQLQAFLREHPEHPLATAVRFRLGAVLVTRAQTLTDEAKTAGDAGRAEPLAAQAREMFEQAFSIYQSLQGWLRDKLVALPRNLDPATDAGLIDERDRLRSRYVEVQLLKTTILQKKADTYPRGSPEYLQALAAAAADYREMYRKYPSLLGGLYARLYEGRCYQDSGDLDAALAAYQDLLDLKALQSPFFLLKTQALKAALECWLDESRREYGQAVGSGEAWLAGVDEVQLRGDEAIQVVQTLARVYRSFADSLTADEARAAQYRQRAAELESQADALRNSRSRGESGGKAESTSGRPDSE